MGKEKRKGVEEKEINGFHRGVMTEVARKGARSTETAVLTGHLVWEVTPLPPFLSTGFLRFRKSPPPP